MNKNELICVIASIAELSRVEAIEALNATLNVIANALKAGDSIQLIGFGTFKIKHRNTRIGRNTAAGVEMQIVARKAPAFVASKVLRDAVN